MYKLKFSVSLVILVFLGWRSGFSGETLKKFEEELQELIQSNKESIVTVKAKFSHKIELPKDNGFFSLFKGGADPEQKEVSFINIGTGVIFNESGHIITRSSTVMGSIKNEVAFADGTTLEAEFIGSDSETGFALIKVDTSKLKELKPAIFSDSTNVDAGSWNFIMGNALGVYPAIVIGTVNGVREDGMIQISANLSPGNNGSPIINLRGEVIGLVAGQLLPDGDIPSYWGGLETSQTTMAYPCNRVKKIANDIRDYGYVKRGWLGVVGYYDGQGPKISKIKANSPAEEAGLEKGDIVLKFSGKKIKNISHFAGMVESTSPGKQVELEVMRSGQIFSTIVQLAEKHRPEIYSFHSDSLKSHETPQNQVYKGRKNNYLIQKRHKMLVERINFLEQELKQIKQQLTH